MPRFGGYGVAAPAGRLAYRAIAVRWLDADPRHRGRLVENTNRSSASQYWIWYRKTDRMPLRLIFEWPSDRLAPFSRFALSYQIASAPIDPTGLNGLVAACKRSAPPGPVRGPAAVAERLDGMEQAPERADAALKRLIPALNSSCPSPAELRWPERLGITGLLTPFDATENPVPTEVLFDWTVPAQRTRIFPRSQSRAVEQDALLLEEGGYTIAYPRSGAPRCTPGLPGTVRPDWPARAPCTCEALIEPGTVLTDGEAMQILSCPLGPPRNAWAWYGLSGRPRLFMVTSLRRDIGAGNFAVLDYVGWTAHRRVPRSAFHKPPQCTASSAGRPASSVPSHCSTCHSAKPQ